MLSEPLGFIHRLWPLETSSVKPGPEEKQTHSLDVRAVKQPAVLQPPGDAARCGLSAGVPAVQETGAGAGALPHSPHWELGHAKAEGVGRARVKVGSVCQRELRLVDTQTQS